MDILEAVTAGKVREIAIAHKFGDSVHYHSLPDLTSAKGSLRGVLAGPEVSIQLCSFSFHSPSADRSSVRVADDPPGATVG